MVRYGVAVHNRTNVGESAGWPKLEGINDPEKDSVALEDRWAVQERPSW